MNYEIQALLEPNQNNDNDIDIGKLLEQRKTQLIIKRVFDLVASFMGLIILSPVFPFIALAIKLDSPGPVFFRQIRIGKNGQPFKIFKFRTMVKDAEKLGLQITVGEDIRVTKIGRILRKYKLDEFPQLINVLVGDMSFVGPRPEVPKYVEMYTKSQRNVLKLRPGITDFASITYKDENTLLQKTKNPEMTYINEIIPKKNSLNIEYIKRLSLIQDLKLIFLTIFEII